MSVAHYKQIRPATNQPEETVRYICLESPCKDNGVVILALGLDAHTARIHGADHIEVSF